MHHLENKLQKNQRPHQSVIVDNIYFSVKYD